MPTIHQDVNGVFVRTNGSVYRPVKTVHSYPLAAEANVKDASNSVFVVGDKVLVKHRSQSPFCYVRNESRTYLETWHSHGCYMNGSKNISTALCWTPITK